ncbi:hypothetical protein GCM10009789_81160 [Kribbella sancticallisti]|uniref:Uncharacterized protein n=1 Tax=Kribbella sancticallisti TaxID=460087 RepID=A0ABN2ERM8_9ACTN
MFAATGFAIRDGRFEPTNWRDVILNPSFTWRYPHMLVAVLISAGSTPRGPRFRWAVP